MNPPAPQRDLVVLVADADMRITTEALLQRAQSFSIREISYEVYTHPQRDPGCFGRSERFLAPFQSRFSYALVLFDRMGCGHEAKSREELEKEVEDRFTPTGWRDRVVAIVIDPELENWVWSDSPHVDAELGWKGRNPTLGQWLAEKAQWQPGTPKPQQPKEAMLAALKEVRKPRSPSIFGKLAATVGLGRCTDPAFTKFKATLRGWFQENKVAQ